MYVSMIKPLSFSLSYHNVLHAHVSPRQVKCSAYYSMSVVWEYVCSRLQLVISYILSVQMYKK